MTNMRRVTTQDYREFAAYGWPLQSIHAKQALINKYSELKNNWSGNTAATTFFNQAITCLEIEKKRALANLALAGGLQMLQAKPQKYQGYRAQCTSLPDNLDLLIQNCLKVVTQDQINQADKLREAMARLTNDPDYQQLLAEYNNCTDNENRKAVEQRFGGGIRSKKSSRLK